MLKYIKEHMASIEGIEIYPILSFLIFFLFFLGVGWWAFKADKKRLDRISRIPLDDQAE